MYHCLHLLSLDTSDYTAHECIRASLILLTRGRFSNSLDLHVQILVKNTRKTHNRIMSSSRILQLISDHLSTTLLRRNSPSARETLLLICAFVIILFTSDVNVHVILCHVCVTPMYLYELQLECNLFYGFHTLIHALQCHLAYVYGGIPAQRTCVQ